jgi:hypothetical protein
MPFVSNRILFLALDKHYAYISKLKKQIVGMKLVRQHLVIRNEFISL